MLNACFLFILNKIIQGSKKGYTNVPVFFQSSGFIFPNRKTLSIYTKSHLIMRNIIRSFLCQVFKLILNKISALLT